MKTSGDCVENYCFKRKNIIYDPADIDAANKRLSGRPASEVPAAPQKCRPDPEPTKPCDASSEIDSGARFAGLTGQVEVAKDCDLEEWRLARMETVLFVLMHIRTQEESYADISFADMSRYMLKPESEVVVTTPPEKESKIKLVMGNIWVNIKKMVTTGSMDIEMCQAAATIKGTTLVCSESGKTSTVKVIEGKVEFTAKANGQKVTLTKGQTISATSAGLGPVSTFDIAAEQATWKQPARNSDVRRGIAGAYFVSALGPGGAVLPPHRTPWQFREDGTVEAVGFWKGVWTKKDEESIRVTITVQNTRDEFDVRFEDGGRVMKAFKDGTLYRQGVRRD
ncbi:MAG: FecR family protein [Desulfatirhabdiaceae bacterium]